MSNVATSKAFASVMGGMEEKISWGQQLFPVLPLFVFLFFYKDFVVRFSAARNAFTTAAAAGANERFACLWLIAYGSWMARLFREADSYRRAAGSRWNSFAIGFHNPPISPPGDYRRLRGGN